MVWPGALLVDVGKEWKDLTYMISEWERWGLTYSLVPSFNCFILFFRNFFVGMMFLSGNKVVLFLFCRFQFCAMTVIVLVKHFFTYLATNASIVIHTTPAWLVLVKIPDDMGQLDSSLFYLFLLANCTKESGIVLG